MTTEPQVDLLTELNINIAEWEQRRDAACIEKLAGVLSPSLIFRRADGSVADKDTFMRGLQTPSPFAKRESHDVVVTITGDRALVTLLVIGTKHDGSAGRYRNVRLFFRSGAAWQLEFWFNDDVSALPAPR